MADELDEYLARHTALPSLGAGRFSLDPSRQQKMLAGLGLLEVDHGFLKLAQAAVRSLSPHFRVSSAKEHLEISFTPTTPAATPLWSMEGVEIWQRDLALGILTLSQEYRVLWQTETHCGKAAQGQFEERRDQQEPGPLRLLLQRRRRWWERSWTGRIKRLFDHKLGFIPLEAFWDGQPVRRMERLSAEAEALVYDPQGGLHLPARSLAKQVQQRGQGPGGLAWMAAGTRSWSQACFVLQGVHLGWEPNLLDRPGITGVFCGSGLPVELSGLRLVHGQEFRQFLEGFRPEVRWLDSLSHP